MFIYTLKFDKKKAAFAVIMVALVIIGIILLVGAHDRKEAGSGAAQPQVQTQGKTKPVVNVKNEKNRVAYLAQYGWEVESPALSEDTVIIPRTFSQVFEAYNELQKSQGFDLSEYCGMEVKMYTYRVTNDDYADDEVLAELYVCNGCVIGGDVHSTSMDGFMCGIKK